MSQRLPAAHSSGFSFRFAAWASCLLLALYYYLELKWFIDFAYGEYRIRLKSPVLVALLFFFIQFTLSILTLGLYLPVALAMIYRFLVDNTVLLSGDGDEAGRFGYQGRFGYDCLYVFGQSMLVLLTAGIYLAWATARIGAALLRAPIWNAPIPGSCRIGNRGCGSNRAGSCTGTRITFSGRFHLQASGQFPLAQEVLAALNFAALRDQCRMAFEELQPFPLYGADARILRVERIDRIYPEKSHFKAGFDQ